MKVFVDNEQFRLLLAAYPGKAIRFLWQAYGKRLFIIAYQLTGDKMVAEDIVQETLIHVWENHRKLSTNTTHPILYYLIRVVKNKSITHYKRHLVEQLAKKTMQNAGFYDPEDVSIESGLLQDRVAFELRKVISSFPKREQECLFLRMDHGLTYEQIATMLNVTKKAVERSLTSAKKRLKRLWKRNKCPETT